MVTRVRIASGENDLYLQVHPVKGHSRAFLWTAVGWLALEISTGTGVS